MKKGHLIKELSVADYITLTATLLIVIAIWLLWKEKTYLAISVTFVSMFLDYLDGTVARRYGGSAYGKVLDSLYDILGFVLFPSLLIINNTNWAWWALVVAAIYHLSACLRLARFTTQGYVEGDKRYYVGVPVLFSKYAVLVSLFAGAKLSVLILAIMIPFMVSSKLIKKPHPLFAQLNLIYAVIFLLLYLK